MRLTRRKNAVATPQLNMAPMVDVVFQLLLFFMCTSSMSQLESKLSSALSRLGPGKPQGAAQPVLRVRLEGTAQGVLVTCDERRMRNLEELTAELQSRAALEDRLVVIEGQEGVPFRWMVAALDACHRARVQRVAFAAGKGRR